MNHRNLFDQRKNEIILNLTSGLNDNSPRGHVDIPISELVDIINQHENHVTTSSCSGRISVFVDSKKTKGIEWILVRHCQITSLELLSVIEKQINCIEQSSMISMKCEPMILHVECRSIEDARSLHTIAMDCGLRESGITLGQKKIMVAIRTTSNSMELPLVVENTRLFDDFALQVLVSEANTRLGHNFVRIEKLLSFLKERWKWPRFQYLESISNHLQINRWGHAMCVSESNIQQNHHDRDDYRRHHHHHNNSIDIFGGYGLEQNSLKSSRNLSTLIISTKEPIHMKSNDFNQTNVMHGCVVPLQLSNHPSITIYILSGGRKSPSHCLPCIHSIVLISSSPLSTITSHSTESIYHPIEYEEYGHIPMPRWGHSITYLDKKNGMYLLIGGRDESNVFNDCYILKCICENNETNETNIDTNMKIITKVKCYWENLNISIPKLFFHSVCLIPYYYDMDEFEIAVLLHGGLSSITDISSTNNHAYMILPQRNQSYSVEFSTGKSLPKRFGHSLTYIGNRSIVLIGGTSFEENNDGNEVDQRISYNTTQSYVFDISYMALEKSKVYITSIYPLEVIQSSYSNNPSSPSEQFISYDHIPCMRCRCHHQSYYDSSTQLLYILGGGSMCLGFGPHYCSSVVFSIQMDSGSISSFVPSSLQSQSHTNSIPSIAAAAVVAVDIEKNESKAIEVMEELQEVIPAIVIEKSHVKSIKTYLEQKNWFDKSRRISPFEQIDHLNRLEIYQIIDKSKIVAVEKSETYKPSISNSMTIPIHIEFYHMLTSGTNQMMSDFIEYLVEVIYGPNTLPIVVGNDDCNENNSNNGKDGMFIYIQHRVSPHSKTHYIDHYRHAKEYIESVILKYHLPSNAKLSIPKKYEFIGDVLMIPEDSFHIETWNKILQPMNSEIALSFWGNFAKIFDMKRVARKARIDTGPKRESQVTLLYPFIVDLSDDLPIHLQPGWVEVIENKIVYGFDITKVMFCSGNVTERMRMSYQSTKNEVIVDLYCGIGYYTLPFLVHGHAKHVHACEWNIHSIQALKHNLHRMKVSDRCTIYHGDNQQTIDSHSELIGIADRVCLGLLPSSTKGWSLAVRVLKNSGGMLHVHENVMENEIKGWIENTIDKFKEYFSLYHNSSSSSSNSNNKIFEIQCIHLEKVKSYAPRVYHIVADLKCIPIVTSSKETI